MLGDQEARDSLLQRLYAALRQHARRAVGGSDEADDLVHDALLKSLRELENLRKPGCFLHRALQFISDGAKTLRKRHRRHLIVAEESEWESIERIQVHPPVLRQSDCEHLRALLHRVEPIPANNAPSITKMMLRHFEEHGRLPSLRQIASELGISHGQAQRSRRQILALWRRDCREAGLYTPNGTSL
jgi:RNA polymerase sigma factor (sigma-70 family)